MVVNDSLNGDRQMLCTFINGGVLVVALLLVDAYSVVRAEITAGRTLYENNCAVCHGPDGEGAMPGVRSMTVNTGWPKKSDQELVAMIINGVESTDGPVSMPPKGGNPSLTEEQIHSIVNYLRRLVGNDQARTGAKR